MLWRIWVDRLGGILAVKQASGLECLVFDPFSFQQDGLAAPKVNISWRQVGYILVVSKMVVVAVNRLGITGGLLV